VLDYFQPKWYWIENPWLSRMRDYITDLPHVCVDYCQYSDWGYRKRTRLWTNIPLTPLVCDSSCPNMVGKRHRVNLITRGGYLHEKYRVPPQLIEELLGAVTPKAVKQQMVQRVVARPAGPERKGAGEGCLGFRGLAIGLHTEHTPRRGRAG
jgi:hypothetical protein